MTPGISLHEVTVGTTDRTVLVCLPASTPEPCMRLSGPLLPPGTAADPDPETTWSRGITLLTVDPPDVPRATTSPAGIAQGGSDPGGPRAVALPDTPGPDQPSGAGLPAGDGTLPHWADAVGAAIDQRAAVAGADQPPIGVVGWSTGGLAVLALAGRRPDLVDRLVLVATPVPPDLGFDPAGIAAKALLLYGAKDPAAGPRDGKWFQQRLPNRRYEQVPGDGALLLARIWPRVLSHLAPNSRRAQSRPA